MTLNDPRLEQPATSNDEWNSIQEARILKLKESVKEDDWDMTTWKDLLKEGEFEFFLEKFPTCVFGWLRWLGEFILYSCKSTRRSSLQDINYTINTIEAGHLS